MKIYHVGGSVRDRLLNVTSNDNDYVVVGATPQDMIDQGYKPVGNSFPVFLHPTTGDEYALARKERSVGDKYTDFVVDFDPTVTLEEDLGRRDLTINAMAWSEEEGLIDPYGGQSDLMLHLFRPTNDVAFQDDPVRVLRVARLRARFGAKWKVSGPLQATISKMSKTGKLSALSADRIWKELSRALLERHPRLFFDTLLEVDALHTIFPDIYRLKSALESHRWHPEGDAYEHTMLVLNQAAKYSDPTSDRGLARRVNALLHDIGKGQTPLDKLPAHHGHDVVGAGMIGDFATRYAMPKHLSVEARYITRYHMAMHNLATLNAKTIVKMLDAAPTGLMNACFQGLEDIGCDDERGRLGSEREDVGEIRNMFQSLVEAYKSVSYGDIVIKKHGKEVFASDFYDPSKDGLKIAQLMTAERVQAVYTAKKKW